MLERCTQPASQRTEESFHDCSQLPSPNWEAREALGLEANFGLAAQPSKLVPTQCHYLGFNLQNPPRSSVRICSALPYPFNLAVQKAV